MSAKGPVRAAATTRADWETPNDLWERLHAEFHFNVDAAASEANAKGSLPYYGPGQLYPGGRCLGNDAFEADIGEGVTAWCNPPYGRGLNRWCGTFGRWNAAGATVVALLPANTDTEWFSIVWAGAAEIRFMEGRIPFVGTTSSNTGGSMLAVYRPYRSRLRTTPDVSLWDWKRDVARYIAEKTAARAAIVARAKLAD